MILFGCTSVFQLLIIIYLMEKEYKNDKREKKLFILDHVTNLVIMFDKLVASGFWDEIIIIHSDKAELNDINQQVDDIRFSDGDVFHLFGLEYVSFYTVSRLPENVRCIFTDEGIMSKVDLKESIKNYYDPAWFNGREFEFNRIDELWLLDERLSMNNLQIPTKNLSMAMSLNNQEFRKSYLEKLALLFPDAVNNNVVSDLIFFDSYYLGIYEMISPELEAYLLQKLCKVLGEYNLVIKPHPGEMNYEKYNSISSKVLKESYIPWEVFRLFENQQQSAKKRVLITYSVGGAIMSEKWLLNNPDTYFIFINGIYDKYSRKPVFVFDLLPKFVEVFGNDRFYYPKSFTELKNIVDEIMGNKEENNDFLTVSNEKEQEDLLNWFIEDYKKNWINRPPYYNYTTLLANNEKGWHVLDELRCISDQSGKFLFTFHNRQDEQDNTSYRWYAIRSKKVKIRINTIICETDEKIENINMELLVNAPVKDKDGYFIFDNFDPVIEFKASNRMKSITIEGDWIFNDRFSGALETLNKSAQKYEKLLIERDKNYEKNLIERDKNYEKYLIERDKIIENLRQDIIGRDKVISELSAKKKKKFLSFKK